MGSDENKKVMARNIKKYMAKKGVTNQQLCDDLDFKYTTFMDWIKGVTYPRMPKVEAMADYFGILKSDLIEEKTPEREEMEKKAGTVADAVLKMKNDPDFFSIVNLLLVLDQERLKDVLDLLTVFLK